ncbi:MAG TPA: DUF6580 family putative transport protein [Gemmataceae bacterium]|jgi:hypothetical protein|nr:DUF6580 family putative transport protein [Gemmataceae bacterium]
MQTANPKPAGILTALTAAAAVALRLARVPNVTAVGALGLYAGARLPLWLAWMPSMAVMAVTDLVLAKLYAWPPFDPWVYIGFLGYVVLGRLLLRNRSAWRIGAAAVLGGAQFYLISNFGTWYTSHGVSPPMYPPTFAGLIACYVAGLPFLGYTLLGDLGFTAAVFAAEAALTRTVAEPAAEEVRA